MLKPFVGSGVLTFALMIGSCSSDASKGQVEQVEQVEQIDATAQSSAESLRTEIPDITKLLTITEDNDPNDLIGRPNGYTAATIVFDSRVWCPADDPGVDCGATIEEWPSNESAEARAEYIQEVLAASPILGGEWGTVRGNLLLRVTGQLKPSDAEVYEEIFLSATDKSDASGPSRPDFVDTDGDGVIDVDDFRPQDPKVQTPDDVDTDRDGVPDYEDGFPKNAKYSKDADGDLVPDALDDFPKNAKYSKDTDHDGVADSQDAFPTDPGRFRVTLAMENALASAQNYLDYSPFSRLGLIDQLSSDYGEGFKVEDATWAVNRLRVDWRQQAVLSARNYLDYSSFSRQGLINQLSSSYGEQFTLEEAVYAVNKIGL